MFGGGGRALCQPLPGLFDPFLSEVLVGRLLIDTGKQPVKMIAGQAGLPGKAIQVDPFMKIFIYIDLSRYDLFIYVRCDSHKSNRICINPKLMTVIQTITGILL